MKYDELLELLKTRRSTRRFKPDPIPDDYVDKIIEAARWAPSGFNLQPWEFVVVKDQKLKESIVQFCRTSGVNNGPMEATREAWQGKMTPPVPPPNAPGGDFSVAPVYILCCGDTRTNLGLPMVRRYNPPATQEAFSGGLASAFLYMHLAAATLGLGSQWVSAVSTAFAHCMIKNLLGIPVEFEIYDMMAVGYAALPPAPRPMREKKDMVHFDRSPESYRTDEQVREFIRLIRTGH